MGKRKDFIKTDLSVPQVTVSTVLATSSFCLRLSLR